MNIAILGFSIVGAVTGTASLIIMLKTAHKVDTAVDKLKTDIDGVKAKVGHNAKVVKTALAQMEM